MPAARPALPAQRAWPALVPARSLPAWPAQRPGQQRFHSRSQGRQSHRAPSAQRPHRQTKQQPWPRSQQRAASRAVPCSRDLAPWRFRVRASCSQAHRFYELDVFQHEPTRNRTAQRAGDATTALSLREAGFDWTPAGRLAAQVGTATRHPRERIGDGMGSLRAVSCCRSDPQQLRLRRDPSTTDAAASGNVSAYGAGSSAASSGTVCSTDATSTAGSSVGSPSSDSAESPLLEPPPLRSATLSLSMFASAWWLSMPQ